jgi:hypothetical protein
MRVNEITDYFTGSEFGDDSGSRWKVEKVIALAKSDPKYFHKNFPLSKLIHDLEWWEDSPAQRQRVVNADTSFPLLVINDNGHLSVADGLNRMKKAVSIENKKVIDVYIVPKQDIANIQEL